MRAVRIVSDGTPKGTHIYDAATGEKLEGIQSVKLELTTRGNRMRATLVERARVDEVLITEADVEEQQGEVPRFEAPPFAQPPQPQPFWPTSPNVPPVVPPFPGSTYVINTCDAPGGH